MTQFNDAGTPWSGVSRLLKMIAAILALILLISWWMGRNGALCPNTAAAVAPAAAISAPAVVPSSAPAPAAVVEASKGATLGAIPAAKVYFAVNKYEPPAEAAKELDAMVVYARANPSSQLSVSGFHDKTGDVEKNHELAKNRAIAVKNVLVSAGVAESSIILQKPQETTGGADDREARRVEVSVAQK